MCVIKTARKKLLWGITIDSKSNFDSHIRKLCKKSGQKLNAVSRILIYCKILLIHPGRTYRQRTNLMSLYLGGLIYGERGGLIFGRKNTSICNLLTYFSFFFFSLKHQHFSPHARCEICSKLTIKTPGYVKLMIKLKIQTKEILLTLFCSLY